MVPGYEYRGFLGYALFVVLSHDHVYDCMQTSVTMSVPSMFFDEPQKI